MKTLEQLETLVVQWANDRNLIEGSTPKAQWRKTLEEVWELHDAVFRNDHPEIRDAIGDSIVTLIIQCRFHGFDLRECLEAAYEEIKDRKGRMVDGMFVKEADLGTREHLNISEGSNT